MAAPELWDDQARAADILRERASLIQATEEYAARRQQLEDLELLLDMALEEEDHQTLKEVARDLTAMERDFSDWELKLLLGAKTTTRTPSSPSTPGPAAPRPRIGPRFCCACTCATPNARVLRPRPSTCFPGTKPASRASPSPSAALTPIGYLKSENGIHRLVRISPFDASGRRHTSFAAVQVLPEVDDRIDIDIQEKDLRIDTFRASGPGGQHVNKTSSAVRLTHLPTGLVVSSQSERSQHRNRELAMKVLRARLYNLEKRKQEEKKQEMQETQKEIAWGSQIRSYTLQPYRMIKDHRTKHEEGNVDAVLDGDLDRFVEAYLLNPGEE